jgi:hypothetical protein
MKRLILAVILLLLSGCAGGIVNTKAVDGKTTECSGYYLSMFRDTEALNLSACGAQGGSTGAKINTQLAGELLKLLVAAP